MLTCCLICRFPVFGWPSLKYFLAIIDLGGVTTWFCVSDPRRWSYTISYVFKDDAFKIRQKLLSYFVFNMCLQIFLVVKSIINSTTALQPVQQPLVSTRDTGGKLWKMMMIGLKVDWPDLKPKLKLDLIPKQLMNWCWKGGEGWPFFWTSSHRFGGFFVVFVVFFWGGGVRSKYRTSACV